MTKHLLGQEERMNISGLVYNQHFASKLSGLLDGIMGGEEEVLTINCGEVDTKH